MSIRANEGWRLGYKLINTSAVIFIHDLAIFLYRHKLVWHGRVVFEYSFVWPIDSTWNQLPNYFLLALTTRTMNRSWYRLITYQKFFEPVSLNGNWKLFDFRAEFFSKTFLTFSPATKRVREVAVSAPVALNRSATSHPDCRRQSCSQLRWCCRSNRCRSFSVSILCAGAVAAAAIYVTTANWKRFQLRLIAVEAWGSRWVVQRSDYLHQLPTRWARTKSTTTTMTAFCASIVSPWQTYSSRPHRRRAEEVGVGSAR